MNEDLKYTFNTINDWLKFAEAKNAGVLALNIACIIGLIEGDKIFTENLIVFEGILILLFCISSCFCFYTILPVLNKGFRFYKKMDDGEFNNSLNSLNALYYMDIARLSALQFNALFEHKHGVSLTSAEKDFGNQITNNAEICVQKYNFFKISAWISFSSFVLGAFLVIVKSIY